MAFAKPTRRAQFTEPDWDSSMFTPAGRLIRRLDSAVGSCSLGVTQAPTDFGAYSHDLLVGQFGNGQILVFDPVTGHSLGRLRDAKNAPIAIDGLWESTSAAARAPGRR